MSPNPPNDRVRQACGSILSSITLRASSFMSLFWALLPFVSRLDSSFLSLHKEERRCRYMYMWFWYNADICLYVLFSITNIKYVDNISKYNNIRYIFFISLPLIKLLLCVSTMLCLAVHSRYRMLFPPKLWVRFIYPFYKRGNGNKKG